MLWRNYASGVFFSAAEDGLQDSAISEEDTESKGSEATVAYIDTMSWKLPYEESRLLRQLGSSLVVELSHDLVGQAIAAVREKHAEECWINDSVAEVFQKADTTYGATFKVLGKKDAVGGALITLFPSLSVVETLAAPRGLGSVYCALLIESLSRILRVRYIDFQTYIEAWEKTPRPMFQYKKNVGCALVKKSQFDILKESALAQYEEDCGKCCGYPTETLSNLTDAEAMRIGYQHVKRISPGVNILKITASGKCPFSSSTSCGIHANRPQSCRSLQCGSGACFKVLSMFNADETQRVGGSAGGSTT